MDTDKEITSKIYGVKRVNGKCVLYKKKRNIRKRIIKFKKADIETMEPTERAQISDALLVEQENAVRSGDKERLKAVLALQSNFDPSSSVDVGDVEQTNTGIDQGKADIFAEIEAGSSKTGKGVVGRGLFDHEIQKIMKNVPSFAGVIAADEIKDIPAKDTVSFVMNLDPRSKQGSHWVAVYIDAKKDQSVEYFDSFGVPASNRFKKDIKILVDKIDPDYMLKFKSNHIKHQDVSTDTCGFFATKFISDRSNGKSFAEASGFDEPKKKDISEQKEKDIKKFKKKFGYI